MSTIIISIIVFAAAVVGMAVGVIVSNKRIKGSCGGMSDLAAKGCGTGKCDTCGAGGSSKDEES